ncbi:hypothetical protein TNCV_1747001 [Trichonephila clavipes]|nr:hypothetical protein TNCV_1747001 [Trichonephila clavipes]
MEREWSPDRPYRGRHNKEDQFDPEKAEEGTIAPTSKIEQDQATRMPDEEVINNGKTRKGEDVYEKVFVPGDLRRKRQIQVIRTSSFANSTPLAHADASRDVLPRGGTSQSGHTTVDEIVSEAADYRLTYTMANCHQRR